MASAVVRSAIDSKDVRVDGHLDAKDIHNEGHPMVHSLSEITKYSSKTNPPEDLLNFIRNKSVSGTLNPRNIIRILNTLTDQTFDAKLVEIIKIGINTEDNLKTLCTTILNTCIMDPKYCNVCARFCKKLSNFTVNTNVLDEKTNMTKVLLNFCNDEVKKCINIIKTGEEIKTLSTLTDNNNPYLITLRFIAELYNINVICRRNLLGYLNSVYDSTLIVPSDQKNPDQNDKKNVEQLKIKLLCKTLLAINHKKVTSHEELIGLVRKIVDLDTSGYPEVLLHTVNELRQFLA